MRIRALLSVVIVLLILTGCSEKKKEEQTKIVTKSEPIKKAPVKKAPYKMVHSRTVHTKSTGDITGLFKEINYSFAGWNRGNREIPRLYITDISSRWGDQSQRISTKTKKAIFFQLTIPLILRSNELVLLEREKLLDIAQRFEQCSSDERKWLQALAKKYRLNKSNEDSVDQKQIDELLMRVNTIPPALAMAQAAEESGWGTSHFAMLGNSLYGQWDFSGRGMIPKNQRKELGNYGLARFKTPQHAVNSYMLNLNTHRAYKRLRSKRSALQKAGKKMTGFALADTLDKYSERGYDYVKSLHKIMRHNHLSEADNAYLWDKETIFLTPLPDPKPKPKPKSVKQSTSFDTNQTLIIQKSESNQTESNQTENSESIIIVSEGNETNATAVVPYIGNEVNSSVEINSSHEVNSSTAL